MRNNKIIVVVSIVIFLFCFKHSNAQSFTDGLHIGIKGGASKLLGESGEGISGLLNEFDNSFGAAYDFELSKYLGSHFEVGFESGASTLKGETYDPQFSAEGFHGSMSPSIDDPIAYENKLVAQKIFASYYLRDVKREGEKLFLNVFARAGLGHLTYRGTIWYIDPADGGVFFGKGTDDYSEWKMTTAVFYGGGGIKVSLSPKFSLAASAMFNFVRYDFLDVVHNYSPEGERLNSSGLYSEFKLGVFYNFGGSGGNSKKSKGKSGKKGGRGSKSTSTHLPFASLH